MKIFRNIPETRTKSPSVVTIGTFDGFHLGHQAILEQMNIIASTQNAKSTIVTFDPHPKKVLAAAGTPIEILTTTEEKLEIFGQLGIQQTLVIPFTKSFAARSSEDFVKTVLADRLSASAVVIGYDHHFGRNREGGITQLKELGESEGFSVHQVAQFEKDGVLISSTKIRQLISNGELDLVANYMGRHYQLSGIVVKGEGRGKTIGFPTANIQPVTPEKLIPANGVYAVDVLWKNNSYKGMMNIGTKPTFHNDSLTLEVHLINIEADLYNQKIAIIFKKRIRSEQKFTDANALKTQLIKDKKICENL